MGNWKGFKGWTWFVVVFGTISAAGAMAGSGVKIMTRHSSHPDAPDSIWLKEYRMMRIEISGPGRLALRFRQVLVADRIAAPVDLTVVRDDEEQGTIRFSTPGKEGEFSHPVMVLIDVPAGRHTYRLLVSGPHRGVVVKTMEGKFDADTDIISLSTSLEQKQGLKLGILEDVSPRKEKTKKVLSKVMRPQNDVLESVSVSRVATPNPRTSLLYNNPDVPTRTLGPGATTAGGMMFVFLLSSASLAASAGVQSHRARQEPSAADELLGRAKRTNHAAMIMAGAACLALMTAVVMYFIEDDAGPVVAADEPKAGFSIRF